MQVKVFKNLSVQLVSRAGTIRVVSNLYTHAVTSVVKMQ